MFENMQMNMNSGIDLVMKIKLLEFEKKLKKKIYSFNVSYVSQGGC